MVGCSRKKTKRPVTESKFPHKLEKLHRWIPAYERTETEGMAGRILSLELKNER
jgi:hypothetical protein